MRALREGWDATALLEVCAAREADEVRWCDGLLRAARAVFAVPDLALHWRCPSQHRLWALGERPSAALHLLGEGLRARRVLYGEGPPVVNVCELLLLEGFAPEIVTEAFGWSDVSALRAVRGDVSVVLWWGVPAGTLEHSERDVVELERVAAALEVALRQRGRDSPLSLPALRPLTTC